MKELGSEVTGGGKDSEQTQPNTKNPIVRTGGPVKSEQPSGSSRIDTGRTKFKQGKTKSILYGCESFEQGTQRSV